MKRVGAFMAVLFLSLAWNAFADSLKPFRSLKGKLEIVGAPVTIEIMNAAARDIRSANPDLHIAVAEDSSVESIYKVAGGLADLGTADRPLSDFEMEKHPLRSFPFAIDGVTVVVNPGNAVTHLTKEQLIGIFTGQITNWQEVGGPDAGISLYVREKNSTILKFFEEIALEEQSPHSWAHALGSSAAIKIALEDNPQGIGFVGLGDLDSSVKALVIDGMIPSLENFSNGKYKMTRQLYMNCRGEPQRLLKAFINYIYSKEGAGLIKKAGFIPVRKK